MSSATGSTPSGLRLAAALGEVQADVAPGLRVGKSSSPFWRAFLFGRFSGDLNSVRDFLASVEGQITWADALVRVTSDSGPFATIAFSHEGLTKLDPEVAADAANHRAPRSTEPADRGTPTPFFAGPGQVIKNLAADESASEADHDVLLSYADFNEPTVRRLVGKALADTSIVWDPVRWGRADKGGRWQPLGFNDPAKKAPVVDGFHLQSAPAPVAGLPSDAVSVDAPPTTIPTDYSKARLYSFIAPPVHHVRKRKVFPRLTMVERTRRPVLPREQVIVGGKSAAANGSFVAFFHFALDRAKFDAFTKSTAEMLRSTWTPPNRYVSANYVAARLMGRTRKGWSVLEAGDKDPKDHFSYVKQLKDGPAPDPSGLVCPLGAHIRKVNPRVDGTPSDHMIIRRSLMSADRSGLLFVCYQSDLEMGIETLASWANSTWEPEENTTADPIISRGSQEGSLSATILIPKPTQKHSDKPSYPVHIQNNWARVTYGFYGFVPSRTTLHRLIGR